jgi:hypothetical protein
MMVLLPETILKTVFRNTLQKVTLRWMSGMSENLDPFRVYFNFGKSQKPRGDKSGE